MLKPRTFGQAGAAGQPPSGPLPDSLCCLRSLPHRKQWASQTPLCRIPGDRAGELGKTEQVCFWNRGTAEVVRTAVSLPVFIEGDTTHGVLIVLIPCIAFPFAEHLWELQVGATAGPVGGPKMSSPTQLYSCFSWVLSAVPTRRVVVIVICGLCPWD